MLWDTEEKEAVKTFVNTANENWRDLQASLSLPLPLLLLFSHSVLPLLFFLLRLCFFAQCTRRSTQGTYGWCPRVPHGRDEDGVRLFPSEDFLERAPVPFVSRRVKVRDINECHTTTEFRLSYTREGKTAVLI